MDIGPLILFSSLLTLISTSQLFDHLNVTVQALDLLLRTSLIQLVNPHSLPHVRQGCRSLGEFLTGGPSPEDSMGLKSIDLPHFSHCFTN